jgi:AbrB family looped-hinge helix DNA binding protein
MRKLYGGRNMITTTITAKGQVVIPSRIRKHLKLTKGTRLCIIESGDTVILKPLTEDYFHQIMGMLKGEHLTEELLKERKREREREHKK